MDPVSIILSVDDVNACRPMAKAAEIGGASSFRGSDRKKSLASDQLVGQVGQYALSLYLFGSADRYFAQREKANANPYQGDGGQDILGSNIDIKTSFMKKTRKLSIFRLAVRKKERHKDHLYYFGLIETAFPKGSVIVHIVGWAKDEELPKKAVEQGKFKGAHIIMAEDLHIPAPIRWQGVNYA